MNFFNIFKNKLLTDEKFFFLFIFILGILSRSITAYFFGDKVLENEWGVLVNNLYTHNSFSLLRFNDLFIPNLWMPPIYGYFVYLHSLIFGLNEYLVSSVILSQILISSITPLIFYKILSKFFRKNLTILGTLIFTLMPIIVYSSCQISSITIYLMLFILFLKLILDLDVNFKNSKLFYIGIIAAILILTRRDFILIYFFSLFYIFVYFKINFKKILIILSISLIGISPYLTRNYLAFDKLIIHSGFGYNVWKAYNPLAKVEGYYSESYELQNELSKVKKNIYYRINEDKIYLSQAKQYIKENPLKYFMLYLKRLFAFYFFDLDSSQKNYYNFFHIYPNLSLSIISIFGILVCNKKNYKFNYLLSTMIILIFVYASFAVLPRYKVYILPFQIILCLSLINFLIQKLKIKN